CNLRLLVKHLKSGVSVFLEYRNSFIPTEHAKNVASTMDKILSEILTDPTRSVATINILSERNRLQLERWNSAPLEDVQATIHDKIYATVKQSPDQEAICSWDGSLTYQELARLADRLAAHLSHLGVGPEVIVPLCFDKSKWNVVAMLAVLVAGGAFLPLDPAYPEERIQHLVDATDAKVVLCSRSYMERLGTIADSVVAVDSTAFDAFGDVGIDVPHQSQASSRNAAYIIPTSGTTGKPKLTLLEHGNFCTSAQGHVPGLMLDASTPVRVLQFAAHSFDASLIEILTPLMIGGTVCIPDEQTRVNDVAKVINEMRVNHALLTPTFVRFLQPSMVPTLATIVLMGEPMTQSCLETWSKINLVNGYGPSECAVSSVSNPRMTASSDPKNIGYSTSCRAWVVNPSNQHQLVPVGCVGELLLEGHIAGRCYLHDEEKSAKSFITNVEWANGRPFRGYLTGDLVSQNLDGSLSIVGRKDNQVVCNRVQIL
ncbi:acetyl-CoA synthetase-like protein, partial [Polyplosphaeria fusca]